MRMLGNVINLAITLALLSLIFGWSFFCFQQGYQLGRDGTNNLIMDWVIDQWLADKEE